MTKKNNLCRWKKIDNNINILARNRIVDAEEFKKSAGVAPRQCHKQTSFTTTMFSRITITRVFGLTIVERKKIKAIQLHYATKVVSLIFLTLFCHGSPVMPCNERWA